MVIKNALCIHAITIKQKLLTSVASFENVIKTQMSGREKIYETYLWIAEANKIHTLKKVFRKK